MKSARILVLVGAGLLCLLVAGMIVPREMYSPEGQRREPEVVRSTEHTARPAEQRMQEAVASEEDATAKIGKVSVKMSNAEFARLRVSLPKPINKPWRGPLYDSESCFEDDKKRAAVEVLPIWIRKAVLAGETDRAARYLWSYLRFTEDEDPEVATKAVISLYRMGDYSDIALAKMKQWIESGFAYSYSDAVAATSNQIDIRQQVLDELAFAKDKRLNDTIFAVWSKNQASEGKELTSVDYGYYLEKQGRELPTEYWIGRLDKPYGFERTLEIVEKKANPEVTAKLQSIFEELRAKSSKTPEAGRAASVASALFRQTGEVGYRDYLVEQARTQLASGSFKNSLPKILGGLAATNDKVALEVVLAALRHENTTIREMAIDALGKSRDAAAAELLFEAAIQKAKEGKGFPGRELRALLEQNDPNADAKYEELRQALLSGQLRWSATTSDFAALEFFRKHGRP